LAALIVSSSGSPGPAPTKVQRPLEAEIGEVKAVVMKDWKKLFSEFSNLKNCNQNTVSLYVE
jgi:hypothetical protein